MIMVPDVSVHHLTEQQIISISNQFLTNGFHYFKVNDIEHGRSLLYAFLQSLHWYRDIACVTTAHQPLAMDVTDIYKNLVSEHRLNDSQKLIEFVSDTLYADFLWIELTQELLAAPWFKQFEQLLYDFRLDKTMPIMVFTYRESLDQH